MYEVVSGPLTDKPRACCSPNGCQLRQPRLNVFIIGNRYGPLFNRIINIKAKLVYLQLENAVDLVHVNEKSLARRSEMEVSQRLPGTLVIDSNSPWCKNAHRKSQQSRPPRNVRCLRVAPVLA